MSLLERTICVMHRHLTLSDRAVFKETLDEPGFARVITMSKVGWEDMGEPEVITVTVNPGDLLN